LAAGVAEVSLDRQTGKIRVHNIWAAIDAGIAVRPRNLAAQIEGSMVFGLGHVLREKITIKEGRVQESNFNDYLVPRMSDMPNIAVRGFPPTIRRPGPARTDFRWLVVHSAMRSQH
jgi:isoquinoline 1-oxidoreductase beta subunit